MKTDWTKASAEIRAGMAADEINLETKDKNDLKEILNKDAM